MAVNFPLATEDLVALMMVQSVTWTLLDFQELSGNGDGEWLAADLAPPLWQAVVSTVAADADMIEALQARFHLLDGAIRSFYLYDPRRPNPVNDPGGDLLDGETVTISSIETNRKELTLEGLPVGFEPQIGTRFSVTAGSPSRTYFGQFAGAAASVIGDEAGPIEVRPHLRPWMAAGQTVQLLKPVTKVKLRPRTLTVVPVSTVTSRLRFEALQSMAAG